jgi:HSP20 family molecular chaperone IbpA
MDGQNNGETKTSRRWFTVERALLTAVLLLQVGILLRTGRSRETPPEPPARTGNVSEAGTPRRSFYAAVPGREEPVRYVRHQEADRDTAAYQHAQRMMSEMDRMLDVTFDELERVGAWSRFDYGWDSVAVSPACDLRDRNGFYEVAMSLPEASPAGLQVLLENQILTIRFDVAGVHPATGQQTSQGYEQRIRLPGPVADAGKALATLTNGILRVSIPKGAYTSAAPALRLF